MPACPLYERARLVATATLWVSLRSDWSSAFFFPPNTSKKGRRFSLLPTPIIDFSHLKAVHDQSQTIRSNSNIPKDIQNKIDSIFLFFLVFVCVWTMVGMKMTSRAAQRLFFSVIFITENRSRISFNFFLLFVCCLVVERIFCLFFFIFFLSLVRRSFLVWQVFSFFSWRILWGNHEKHTHRRLGMAGR